MKGLASLLITMQNPFTVYAQKWICRQCNPYVTHNTKLNTPQGEKKNKKLEIYTFFSFKQRKRVQIDLKSQFINFIICFIR